MKIKQSVEDVVRNAFVGKKFAGSQFKKSDYFLSDINDKKTDVRVEDIKGKIIKEVMIFDYGYRGISVKFDEFDDWFFFFDNDVITVEE
jgi:hypothetical protein